jgi:hypothetical protein
LAAELQRRAKRVLIAGGNDSFHFSRPKWLLLKPIGTTPPIIAHGKSVSACILLVSVPNVCTWRDP